jgi:hypothetical protein|tara:strand:- start:514 stop:807 length:294 start_codon:yes stop_codon:yes gene_type:complete
MQKIFFIVLPIVIISSGCVSSDDVCEDITLAAEQIHQCQALQRQITLAKGKPIVRTELERRYQQDCIDIRYYRDSQQNAMCGNKHKLNEIRKEIDKK